MRRPSSRYRAGLLVALALAVAQAAHAAPSRSFAIASAGVPRLFGALRGSVIATSQVGQNLVVRVDFGEISPLNKSPIVRAIVPISLRASRAFQLVGSVSGGTSSDPYAAQLSDVGVGLQSLRPAGRAATRCGGPGSQIVSPFHNDPALTAKRRGRARYPASLDRLRVGAALLRGPKLSSSPVSTTRGNGYDVDLILTIVPQYYSRGALSLTLTLKLGPGPAQSCSR